MATPKEVSKSVRLTADDLKVLRTVEEQLHPAHGKLTFTQIVRMALRKLNDREQAA